MAMHIGGDTPEELVDINTTPLIDVMLVLLIMLILTIPVQTHAVKLNMPVGKPPTPTTPPEVVQVVVAADGTVLWNGEAVADRAALEERFRAVAAMPTPPEVHLRPDAKARYDYVAMVMAAAQRQRVTKFGIIGNERFMDN